MISKLEILPNEIFLNIFSYLSWDEILPSLWLLNTRINSLICSIFSTNSYGIIFNKPGLSYKKFSSILLPLILNSSSLSSSIKNMYFDGVSSISFDFIYQEIFYHNDKQRICFPNLKSLYITRCLLTQLLFQTLSSLIKNQLDELTLTFHKDIYAAVDYTREHSTTTIDKKKITEMFHQLLCQIFSDQCQLTSLRLDIRKSSYNIHQCLKSSSDFPINTVSSGLGSYCTSIRRLHIRLQYSCFLEDLIEHVPNLEQLSVHLKELQYHLRGSHSNAQSSIRSSENWFNKVPKLKVFTLKSSVYDDLEFTYLKWLLNNLNHVLKLDIHLYNYDICGSDQMIWKSVIDANFIRQYCLPDQIINLKDFRFYICMKCQLLSHDIGKIINSFQIDPFFINHQWTNVKCFYDENKSYQHTFSSALDKSQFSGLLINYPCVYKWSDIQHIKISLQSSLYLFLQQFNKICPNVSCLSINPGFYRRNSEALASLITKFEMEQQNLNSIHLRNVTKLRLGTSYGAGINPRHGLVDEDKVLAKIFAHIISMTVQLKYLSIARFEWFLYIIQYAFDDLRENVLSTVRHAEFGIPSCNVGLNGSIDIGNHLVPHLSTFMPNLQSLCLWRPDDFPWTSIRPDFKQRRYGVLIHRWQKSLQTIESITQHVTIFEQDLCQLFEQLKQLVYLNIYAKISSEKVEPYRIMVHTRFPNSRSDVHISRFRLWM